MRKGILLSCAILALASVCAGAELSQQEMQTTVESLQQRVRDQDRRLAELEKQNDSRISKEEVLAILKEMKADADKRTSLPDWMENLKFSGDLRLQYHGDFFNWGPESSGEKPDRNRARFRLRFGFTKTWLEDQIEVGFRLASGNNNDPTSTNQTFGESGSSEPPFAKRPIWIDLAYARYAPKQVKGLAFTGGKMKNPFLMNEIFMDTDVNPEGFWGAYAVPGLGPIEPFAGVGYFVLTERSGTSDPIHDSSMHGYQAGVNWKAAKDVKYTFAGYLQDYSHYDTSTAKANGNDSPLSDIPAFRVVGLTNNLTFKVLSLPVMLLADWAHNCRNSDSDIDYDSAENAYAMGAMVGQNKKKGDWSVKYRWARLEANSLPGQFVDSNFGFANRQGHVVGSTYNLLDSLTAGVTLYFTEPIFSPTTTSGSSPFEDETVTVLADLIWKF